MNDLVTIGNREISASALDNVIALANAIASTETKPNGDLYIKFKKDVILDIPNNFAILTDGFNVQYANQIHFNPEFDKDEFKAMIIGNFSDARYKIIEKAAELMDKELTHDEVEAVVRGAKIIEITEEEIRRAARGETGGCGHGCNDSGCNTEKECDGVGGCGGDCSCENTSKRSTTDGCEANNDLDKC